MGWISGSGTAISPTSPCSATTLCPKAFRLAPNLARAIGGPHAPWYPADRGFVNRFFRSALFPLFVIVLLVYLASQTLIPHGKSEKKVSYSEFLQDAKRGDVTNVVISPGKHSISFTIASADKKATVHYPADQSIPQITQILESKNIGFDSKGTGGFSWVGTLIGLLPFVFLFAFWIFLMNQVQGGGSKVMSFGKSRAKRMAPDSPKIGFKDVAGVDEAVEELHEIKEFLENPKKFQALGARIPYFVMV